MSQRPELYAADLERWAYDDDAEAKAIARAAEPDIDPDRD